jgi:prevent-host-death family protein
MMQIRPVSDLRNKFTDIEKIVNDGEPVFLTKNGYGSMVVLSLESYSNLTENVETILVETDKMAELDDKRMSHEEIFGTLRRKINSY